MSTRTKATKPTPEAPAPATDFETVYVVIGLGALVSGRALAGLPESAHIGLNDQRSVRSAVAPSSGGDGGRSGRGTHNPRVARPGRH